MSPQQCGESNGHMLTSGESEVLKDYKELRKSEAEEDKPSNELETQDQSTIVGYRRLKKASAPSQKQSLLSSQVRGWCLLLKFILCCFKYSLFFCTICVTLA
jgi:hypothetical protein